MDWRSSPLPFKLLFATYVLAFQLQKSLTRENKAFSVLYAEVKPPFVLLGRTPGLGDVIIRRSMHVHGVLLLGKSSWEENVARNVRWLRLFFLRKVCVTSVFGTSWAQGVFLFQRCPCVCLGKNDTYCAAQQKALVGGETLDNFDYPAIDHPSVEASVGEKCRSCKST